VNNTLHRNSGHGNARFDGADLNPNCDNNDWRDNDFGTVNQPCVRGPRPGAIAGQVVDAATGAGVGGATVTADGRTATTDAGGSFVIGELAPATYTVTVTAPGYLQASETATVTAGETTTVTVQLQREPPRRGAIAGLVIDANTGAVIVGATVTADGRSATTDASGRYTIADLPPATYTVTVTADGYTQASRTVTVTAGETTTAHFALRAARPPRGDPQTVEDCRDGGWREYGFRNQGQCIRFVRTGQDSRPQNPQTEQDCRNGGWRDYGFRNQGECIRFVRTGEDSRQDGPRTGFDCLVGGWRKYGFHNLAECIWFVYTGIDNRP
ncbi:MAG TPA: carboxypeptidase-like regulatory domain-containing protein, partial [Egibacteraceae bacterium]|nr:carboxypeptidase-like regulatory domain-containing protein [Egibacteraceae bacterium]